MGPGSNQPSDGGRQRPSPQLQLQLLLVTERVRLLGYIQKHFPASLSPIIEPADILHDTIYEAVRGISAFSPSDGSSMFRLLVTIARRRIAQLLRVHGRVKRGGKSKRVGQTDSIVALLSELAVHQRTPSRSAARHEFMAALDGALRQLPADLRTAIKLRYIDDMSPEGVAREMGRTTRAVHQLCYRGMQLLRRELRSASLFV